ncbi:hypothetical protein [Brachybacterium tyrofermentans]|uniref:hypothetical protein n=1 Tax=Brachybacterium tyrofermentans TaxID=47848 RepID=UPI0018681252|nr:hypothetical protein [Brachybacterium tyrofermentans]
MSKSTTSKTTTATENLVAVTAAITKAEEDVIALELEHLELTELAEAGSILADLERLEDVTALLDRRRARVEYLTATVLPSAQIAADAAELARAANGIGKAGVGTAHSAWEREQAEAEAQVAEGLRRLREGAQAWNSAVSPIIAQATQKGIVDGKVDPLLPVRVKVIGTGYRGAQSSLLIGDEEFSLVDPDALVVAALRGADEHAAKLIAEAAAVRMSDEAQRVESFLNR